jgi:hypothetical protein
MISPRAMAKNGFGTGHKKAAWHHGCLRGFPSNEQDEAGNPLRQKYNRDNKPSVDRKFVEDAAQKNSSHA